MKRSLMAPQKMVQLELRLKFIPSTGTLNDQFIGSQNIADNHSIQSELVQNTFTADNHFQQIITKVPWELVRSK